VQVDGWLEEPQYQQAFHWDGFVETEPRENASPSRKTELWLFSNEKGLVMGFRCSDPKPEEIRRQRQRRDEGGTEADTVEIILDPTGEGKQALVLGVSAANDVYDALADLHSGDVKLSFDFLFESATQLTPEGWQGEVLVPFTSLSFSPSKATRMLLSLNRFVPRTDVEYISALPINRESQDPREGMAFLLLDTEGVAPARRWHLIPAWVGSHFRESNGQTQSSQVGSLGITGEWQPRQDTLFKATWRPDFSQVEADDTYQKINNRYPVFVREKRPFFLEGAESFSTPFTLYYSRQIVQPEWGLKLSHRSQDLGLFALVAQEEKVPGERFGLPGSPQTTTWALLRATYGVGEGAFLGLTTTWRGFGGDFHNGVVSVDGSKQGEKLALRFQAAGSRTWGGGEAKEGTALFAQASYKWNQWWSTTLTGKEVSPDFRADAGFVVRRDRRELSLRQEFRYLPREQVGLLRGFEAALSAHSERTTSGRLVWQGLSSYANATLPHQLFISLQPAVYKEAFGGQVFSHLWDLYGFLTWREHKLFQPRASFSQGREVVYTIPAFAGPSRLWSTGFTSTRGPWSFSLDRIHYSFGGQARQQDSWEGSLTYLWGQHWSAKVFYVDERLRFGDAFWAFRSRFVNALLTYRVNPFSALYLGANLALEKEGELPTPLWEKTQTQQVFLKLSWYF
jgi:hypothetical protein